MTFLPELGRFYRRLTRHLADASDLKDLGLVIQCVAGAKQEAVLLFDATFPDHQVHFHLPDGLLVYDPEPESKASSFWQTFRPHGGRGALPTAQSAIGRLRYTERNCAPRNRSTIWVYVRDAGHAARLLDTVGEMDVAILFRGSLADLDMAKIEAPLVAISFLAKGRRATGYVAIARQNAGSVEALIRSFPASCRTRQRSASFGASRVDDRLIDVDCEGHGVWAGTSWAASQLVCDGSSGSEGDSVYSWLWSGPDSILRLALGNIPAEANVLRISFAPSVHHTSLGKDLLFQLNGRPTPHDFRSQADRSGVATISLRSYCRSALVVGIGCRSAHVMPSSNRMIRACIDRVEVSP